MSFNRAFSTAANAVAHAAGMPVTFLACCVVVVLWAVSGPIFGFSDTWQLIINTGTTIITFLMVFLIQNTQNRDGAAVQVKLDELIRASRSENAFIGLEHLTEEEVAEFRDRCENAAKEHGRDVEAEKKQRAKTFENRAAAKQISSKKNTAGKSTGATKAGALKRQSKGAKASA
jgi:low affinity Fe/Cu permease